MKGVFLLGFRGAGKTTLGRRLAAEEGWSFTDLDEAWEKERGETILSFVRSRGIEAFRREEAEFLRTTAAFWRLQPKESPALLATGGGVVDWAPSREILEASPWPKIYLEVPAELLWERLGEGPERKEIGGLSDFSAMTDLLSRRRPYYEKISTYRVKNQDITQALAEVRHLVKRL